MSGHSNVEYDLIVIGAGPGGYHAAQLAATNGHSVALIEREEMGGTCLNWGCIPTKTLLNIAKQCSYSTFMNTRGLLNSTTYQHEMAMKWKDTVVDILRNHVAAMLKRGKVSIINGEAQLQELTADKKIIRVADTEYTAKNLIIASGVESSLPQIAGIAESGALTSRQILSLDTIPQRLAIIGGGVIGIEFAALFSELGAAVTVFEALPEILPAADSDVARLIKEELNAEHNVRFFCGATITEIRDKSVLYTTTDDEAALCPFDTLLVSVGRSAELARFSDAGLAVSKKGIVVDEQMQTNIPGVYAIGDVAGSFQLAHVAYRMAEVAVDTMSGREACMRYHAVPMVVYTHPELASCGLTEAEARRTGREAVSAKLPISVSGRAITEHGANVRGMCKIVADSDSGIILGVHLLAPMASEIISTAAVILEAELRVWEVAEVILPHPTVGEVLRNVSALLAKKIDRKQT